MKKVLLPVVPKMLEIFQPLLQQQDSAASHSGLKINIMDVRHKEKRKRKREENGTKFYEQEEAASEEHKSGLVVLRRVNFGYNNIYLPQRERKE